MNRSMSMRAVLVCAVPVVLIAGLLACGGSRAPEEKAEIAIPPAGEPPVAAAVGDPPDPAASEDLPEPTDEAGKPSFLSEQNQRDVTLFFQDPDSDQLVPEHRQIFLTNSLTDQGKQIVVELIDGPRKKNLLPTMPSETRVLGLYMDRWGTAYVDLSHDFVSRHIGGTAEEIATIFSLVNSLTVNLPAIKRVHILVDGDERDTLKSHLDLRRNFVQNLSIVRGHGG